MNQFDLHDTILYPLTYNDLVLMAQNINPSSGKSLRGELIDLLLAKINEALELFDAHTEEIYRAAFPDEFEDTEVCDLPADKIEELANRIYRLLRKYDMWIDVAIYYNGKCMSTSTQRDDGTYAFCYNKDPFLKDGVNPKDFFTYAGPYLSMSFEGPFYDALNHSGSEVVEEFSKLVQEYGLYYEMGDDWNLSLHKIP